MPRFALPRPVLRRRQAAEPTRRIRLRWGDYQGRTSGGILLLGVGAALIAQTTAYTLALGLLGSALHVTGWLVQPARMAPRLIVLPPALFACWATVTGPKSMWLLSILLLCWLFVRRRPLITYCFVALPLAVGIGVASAFSFVAEKAPAFALMLGAVAVAAWLARQSALRVRFES